MKRWARSAAYCLLRATQVLEAKRLSRLRAGLGWASVLVFHNVSDQNPEDGVTISPARFRAILRTLRRHYIVISTRELVRRVEERSDFTGREVVITFDDGYLDNYEHAVPLLREYELPACFFLTAGYIGTDKRFWWDIEKGADNPLMTWPQAREIVEMGFEVGCHTWSHPDLGVEPLTSVRKELLDAREYIADQTGAVVEHFAFPYGGAHNIRAEWITEIREAGFRSNFHAYNQHVRGTTGPFFIPRIGAAPQRTVAELRIDIDDAW